MIPVFFFFFFHSGLIKFQKYDYNEINNGNWTEWSAIWSCDFKIEWVYSASSIWSHKYNFRPKLHSSQLNYQLVISILKSFYSQKETDKYMCNKYGLLTILCYNLEFAVIKNQKFPDHVTLFASLFPALWLAISAFSAMIGWSTLHSK